MGPPEAPEPLIRRDWHGRGWYEWRWPDLEHCARLPSWRQSAASLSRPPRFWLNRYHPPRAIPGGLSWARSVISTAALDRVRAPISQQRGSDRCRWARPAAMVPAVPGLWLRDARPPLPATTNIALQRTATSRTIIHRQYCRATAPRRTRPGSRRTRLRSSRRLARQSTRLRRLKRRWVTIEGALRLVRPLRRPVLHRRQRHRHRQERFNPIPLPRGGQRHRSCQPPHPSVARRTRPPLRRWQAHPDASSHQSCSAAERCARLS